MRNFPVKIWSKSPISFCILVCRFYEKDCVNILRSLLYSSPPSYLVRTWTKIGIKTNMSASLTRSEKWSEGLHITDRVAHNYM